MIPIAQNLAPFALVGFACLVAAAVLLPRGRFTLILLLHALGLGSALWVVLSPRNVGLAPFSGAAMFGSLDWRSVVVSIQVVVLAVLLLAMLRLLLRRSPAALPEPHRHVLSAVLILWTSVAVSDIASVGNLGDPQRWVFPAAVSASLLLPRPPASRLLSAARIPLGVIVYASLATLMVSPEWATSPATSTGVLAPLPFRLLGVTPHPNALAPAALTFMVLGLGNSTRVEIVNRLAASATLLLTGSLTGWLAALVVSIYLASTAKRNRLTPVARMGLSLLLVGLLAGSAVLVPPVLSEQEQARLATGTGRTALWSLSWEVWTASPILGQGTGVFGEGSLTRDRFAWAGHAHNQVLQTLATTGIVGLVALAFYLAVLIRLAREARSRVLVAMLAIHLTRFLTESPVLSNGVDTASYLHFILLLGLAVSATEVRQGTLDGHLGTDGTEGR